VKFFRIAKWEKFQHYHDRRPPWLKLYTTINDDDSLWRKLSDTQLGQVVRLFAHAGNHNNTMPFHDDLMQEDLELSDELNLSSLEKLGVIEVFSSKKECSARENARLNARKKSSKKREKISPKNGEALDQRTEIRGKSSEREGKKKTALPAHIAFSEAVLLKLNRVTGKNYTRRDSIVTCWAREKCTLEECFLVIDFKWAQWAGTEMQKNMNPTTPFRAKHFQAYLDEARAGPGHRLSPTADFGKYGVEQRNKEAMKQVEKELGYEQESDSGPDGFGDNLERTNVTGQAQGILGGIEGHSRGSSDGSD